jgi:hypothetical protein
MHVARVFCVSSVLNSLYPGLLVSCFWEVAQHEQGRRQEYRYDGSKRVNLASFCSFYIKVTQHASLRLLL